jgi:putative tricarboxylic transport membrane protein
MHGLGSYDFVKRGSKNPEAFGKGSTEGLIAFETGNNAVSGAVIAVSSMLSERTGSIQ